MLHKYKPGASKIVIVVLGAAVWMFAAYRILRIAIENIHKNASYEWLAYLIGIAGFIPFFLLVFRKVSKRYFGRIVNHKHEKPCIFAFFDLRGYIMMSFMISLGIAFHHLKVIPPQYKGIFLVSLGLSLFASSVYYLIEGYKYLRMKKNPDK
jgi:hypothetical protein